MLKLLIVVAILFAAALGFHWLKDASGELTLTLGETAYAVDLTIATLILLAIILLAMGLIWFLQGILHAPGKIGRGWRRRNAERGRAAISQGLIAVAAGDLRAAERAMLEASRRAPDQPLARLLEAQSAQLKGDRAAARLAFQRMSEDPQTRIAGLRGLYVEAEREKTPEAARALAELAREEAPGSPWAARALLRHQTAAGDWEAALATLSGAAENRVVDRRSARRQRAVILTAQALAREDGEPDAARHAAIEAHELAPELSPAAVVAGRLVSRQGDIRRATRILEAAWKAGPHPDVADAYLHVRAGDSASDRLKRAETLLRFRPRADEGHLAVARAAIDARDFARARQVLTPVLTSRPTQKALFLMAELEESESGDRARAREWLARAARAPRDPAWTADGVILDHWSPISPVTGRIDTVEWKVPVAELEPPRFEIDAAELEPPAPIPPVEEAVSESIPRWLVAPEPSPPAANPLPKLADIPQPPPVEPMLPERAEPVAAGPAPSPPPSPTNGSTPPRQAAPATPPPSLIVQPAPVAPTAASAGHDLAPVPPVAHPAVAVGDHVEAVNEPQPVRPPLPDDPGVSEDAPQEERARRFRII